MTDWISIENGAPPEDENVIIFDGKKVGAGRIYVTSEVAASPSFPIGSMQGVFDLPDSWGEQRCRPVAWQPMPSPPIK